MARDCKCGCGVVLPAASKCTTQMGKLRFASAECRNRVAMVNLKKIEAKRIKKSAVVVKQKKKAITKRNADFKAKVQGNDLTHQLELTQKVFNRMRKLEEFCKTLEPICVSCEKPANLGNLDDFACGHFKTAGGFPELRFNTLNTWLQCNQYCNCRLSGNISGNKHTIGYTQGLKNMFDGADKLFRYLERPHKNYTRDCESLKVVRAWCAGRIRQLEKDLTSRAEPC